MAGLRRWDRSPRPVRVRRVHLVAGRGQQPAHLLVAPSAVSSAVDEDVRRHVEPLPLWCPSCGRRRRRPGPHARRSTSQARGIGVAQQGGTILGEGEAGLDRRVGVGVVLLRIRRRATGRAGRAGPRRTASSSRAAGRSSTGSDPARPTASATGTSTGGVRMPPERDAVGVAPHRGVGAGGHVDARRGERRRCPCRARSSARAAPPWRRCASAPSLIGTPQSIVLRRSVRPGARRRARCRRPPTAGSARCRAGGPRTS